MTRLCVIGFLLGLALASAQAEEAPVAGAWVGFTETYGSFFRLELAAEGDGLLANASRARGEVAVYRYRVERWTVEASKIRLELTPLDPQSPAIRVKGRIAANEIDLEVTRGRGIAPARLRLYRESILDEDLRLLRERMIAIAGDQ